jgi:DNA-directed RNA polymerase specialized sigma24 family protein
VMRLVLKGWAHVEIAAELRLEANHVKQLAHRARVRLRQHLTNPRLN